MVLLIDEANCILGEEFAAHFFAHLKSRQAKADHPLKVRSIIVLLPIKELQASVFFSIFTAETAEQVLIHAGKAPNSRSKGNFLVKYYQQDLLQWSKLDAFEFVEVFNKLNGRSIKIEEEVTEAIYNKCDGYGSFSLTLHFL